MDLRPRVPVGYLASRATRHGESSVASYPGRFRGLGRMRTEFRYISGKLFEARCERCKNPESIRYAQVALVVERVIYIYKSRYARRHPFKAAATSTHDINDACE